MSTAKSIDKWSTDWNVDRLDKGTKYTDHNKLPWQCWVTVKTAVLLYFRRDFIYGGKGIFMEVNSGAYYEADALMAAMGSVTMVHMKSVKMIGDDRPVFDTEEEQKAWEEANP